MIVGGYGSGAQLGKRIALHMLHHQRYQVTVLVRPGTENVRSFLWYLRSTPLTRRQNLEKKHDVDIMSFKGAKILQCDIEREPERLRDLLKGIDCVISCVSGSAILAGQRNLIDACKVRTPSH